MMCSDEEYNILTFSYLRFIRRFWKKRTKIIFCVSIAAVLAVLFGTHILSFGYDAYIDGQYIGTVTSRADIENELIVLNKSLSEPIEKSINFYPRIVFNSFFSAESLITDNLKLASGQMHRGVAFCLGGDYLFALDSETEMQRLIDSCTSVYKAEQTTAKATGGDITYVEGIYPNSLFLTYDGAFCVLQEKNLAVQTSEPATENEDILALPASSVEVSGIASGIFIRPIAGVVTSNFGERWGRTHKGTDFAGCIGDDVKASDGGTVTFAGAAGSFGNLIVIDHNNGYETYYAHLSAIYVKNGDKIKKGAVIGAVGNTGNSLGPHLHFEIRENGNAKNPIDFLT